MQQRTPPPPTTPKYLFPASKSLIISLPHHVVLPNLFLSVFLCGSPHCSLNKQRDHLWSASWRPLYGFPLLSSGGISQNSTPKHVSPLGEPPAQGRSLGMTRQASTKRGGNRLHLAV